MVYLNVIEKTSYRSALGGVMRLSRPRLIFGFAFVLAFLFSFTPAFAKDNSKDTPKNKAANEKKTTTSSSKLGKKENPEFVGKRDINNNQINFYSLEKEIAIGHQLAAEVERQLKFIDDPVITEYINRIGQNIALNSDAKVPFTIKVVDSDEVNAFALPGGFFFVNKGLILAADNESEVAGVMAHEIAHVAARHGTEQVSKGQLINFGSIPLIFLGGPIGIAARSAANLALPLTFLKFSRGAEEEADMLGAQYAWASGYDPAGMVSMFEKLSAKESKKPGTMAKIFSDHPATGDRAETVRRHISQFPQRDEYVVSTSDFNLVKARLQAVSGSRRGIGNGPGSGGDTDRNGRPTLKRRRDDANGGDIDATSQPPAPQNRPTLKRRDGGQDDSVDSDQNQNQDQNQDQIQTPTSDDPPASPNRPTLKRSSGGNDSGSGNN
jgi:beta-barrel assembly-enhancing protease